jgi:hypothetical protein
LENQKIILMVAHMPPLKRSLERTRRGLHITNDVDGKQKTRQTAGFVFYI